MRKQLLDLPEVLRRTMALDKGNEFAQHAWLADAIPEGFNFARPPLGRRTNENTNGRIREFVPKRKTIAEISHLLVNEIQNLLNNPPRKILGYKTPNEILSEAKPKARCKLSEHSPRMNLLCSAFPCLESGPRRRTRKKMFRITSVKVMALIQFLARLRAF